MSPVGLVLGSEANHLQAGTTSHQVCSSRGTEGPGPVSGRSPCICGAAGRKAGSFLLWVSESQCLTRAGRPRSGRDQSLPCPGRVPEHPAIPAGIPAGGQSLASGSKARSTPQNPETLGPCLPGGPESGREHLGQSLAAVLGLSAESPAAVLGCADLAAGEGGGHPRGHLQCGGGHLGIAESFQVQGGAAPQKPHPGLGAPGRSGGATPHPEGLARSPCWKPSSEAAFTLLLTLDPDPPFSCPHRLSCREDTTA